MERAQLVARCDDNLVAYLGHLARSVPGGSLATADGMLLFAGGHAYPGTYTNGVIRSGRGAGPEPTLLLDQADEFFSALGRGYMLWVRTHADDDLAAEARRRGWWCRPPEEGNAGLAIDHPLPAGRPLPPGVELRRVEDEQGWRDYRRVAAVAWQLEEAPDELLETVLFSLASLASPDVDVFVAYDGGRPVSGAVGYTSETGCGDKAVGVQWVGTLPEGRGQGLGDATFRAAANAGFARGASCAVALGSAKGTPIWVRMGFQIVTRYVRFLAPPIAGRRSPRSSTATIKRSAKPAASAIGWG